MRGKPAIKRPLQPDIKHNSTVITKLINMIMQRGKKNVAQSIVYNAFEIIEQKTKQKGPDVFALALQNVSPLLEVKARRIGGAAYQVPIEVKGDRRLALALRWLINSAKARKGLPMQERLALELIDASNNQGGAIKKKEDVQRMAEANRAFAHFA